MNNTKAISAQELYIHKHNQPTKHHGIK